MDKKRPPVRIRFKYNIDTGEIEEFIIDDNAASASEEYHDKIARTVASRLGRNPDISDAGPGQLPEIMPETIKTKDQEKNPISL